MPPDHDLHDYVDVPAVHRHGPLRVGLGGPVGSGKTALAAALCRTLGGELDLAVVTNDIYTTEDADFLRRNAVLPDDRIVAVQTGCCPHTAIRDDITANLDTVELLEERHPGLELVLVESGGDNLTASFSYGLVDAQVFVIDVAGGDKVPRKGGPGVTAADLLVVNKTDLAPFVGVDVPQMVADAMAARDGGPVLALSRHDRASRDALTAWVHATLTIFQAGDHVPVDPGPMAPHFHADLNGGAFEHSHADATAGHDHA
jgi:urease accessory protein